ncbi:MAG: tRNA pseudouridine(13) synthase TruD, partial [Planctomycetota bacterium]
GYYVSAFQSAIFNRVLDERVSSGTLGAFIAGDVAIFHDNQSVFDVDEVTLNEQSTIDRLREFDISPSGPMWGATMKRAGGSVGETELAALHSFGVDLEDLEHATDIDVEMIGGTRRPLRVPVRNVEVEGGVDEHGSYVRCAFDLPRGAFATVVMGEIMKLDRLKPNDPRIRAAGVAAEDDDHEDEREGGDEHA